MNATALRTGDILIARRPSLWCRLVSKVLGLQVEDAQVVIAVNTIQEVAITFQARSAGPGLQLVYDLAGMEVWRPRASRYAKDRAALWFVRHAAGSYQPFRHLWEALVHPRVRLLDSAATTAGLISLAYVSSGYEVAPEGSLRDQSQSEWIL